MISFIYETLLQYLLQHSIYTCGKCGAKNIIENLKSIKRKVYGELNSKYIATLLLCCSSLMFFLTFSFN